MRKLPTPTPLSLGFRPAFVGVHLSVRATQPCPMDSLDEDLIVKIKKLFCSTNAIVMNLIE